MKRSGFTLAEILLAVLLSSAVCAVTVQVTRHAMGIAERIFNRTVALEKGQNVLSIIDQRALHTAFGITRGQAGGTFSRSFGGGTNADRANSPPPARWTDRGPLQIWYGYPSLSRRAAGDGGIFRGRGIALLYAVPSALRANIPGNAPIMLSDDISVQIGLIPGAGLSGIADRLPTEARNDLRSWVTFPLTRLPAYAVYSGGKLSVTVPGAYGLPAALYPYDEMHCLRAERFYVHDGVMYSEELRTSWTRIEPRLEGVLEMWFEWTPSERFLQAWILTTGGSVSSGGTVRPKDWPAEAPWREEFERHDVMVVKGSWILKNM